VAVADDLEIQLTLLPHTEQFTTVMRHDDFFQDVILNTSEKIVYTKPIMIDAEAVMVECGGKRNVLVKNFPQGITLLNVSNVIRFN
jgi:hypothetical protein